MRGSKASRRQSPMKLILITQIAIAKPGGSHNQGAFSRIVGEVASLIMFPQLGVGAWTPRPRNDRLVSVHAFDNQPVQSSASAEQARAHRRRLDLQQFGDSLVWQPFAQAEMQQEPI